MCCSGEEQKTTSTSSAPPWLVDTYRRLLGRAEAQSNTPYQGFTGDRVAGFSPDQMNAFQGVRDNMGVAQPYFDAAFSAAQNAAGPVTWDQVEAAYNPTIDAQVRRVQDDFNYQNAQQAQRVNSQAADAGVITGDRAQVARALQEESNRRQQDPVVAGIRSQAYDRAWQGAEGNRDAAGRGSQLYGQIGQQVQNSVGEDLQRLLAVGGAQQQNQQANYDWNYQQYLDRLRYPYQNIQWATGIAGIGPGFGMTSTGTTQANDSFWGNVAGLGATFAGAYLSDERVKENIVPIGTTHDGQTIYRYNYVGDPTTQIGLIAQEVEVGHPEAVHEGPDGLKRVDYDLATREAAPAMPHMEKEGGFAYGGPVGTRMSDAEFDRLVSKINSAVGTLRGHMQGGRAGYAGGGFVVPTAEMADIKETPIAPQAELPSLSPAQPMQMPSMQSGGGQDLSGLSKLAERGGTWARGKFHTGDMGLGSWAPTVTYGAARGGVIEGLDSDDPLNGFALPVIKADSSFASPELMRQPRPSGVPGIGLDGGVASRETSPAPQSERVIAGMPTSSMGDAYAPPAIEPASPPPAPTPDAPASEGVAWYEPHEGKQWWEPNSNPDLGVALATAGAAMMGNRGSFFSKLGRGVGMGVGSYLSRADAERRQGREDREAELRAAQLEGEAETRRLNREKAQFEMEEAKRGKVYSTSDGLYRVPPQGPAEKLLETSSGKTDDTKEYEYAVKNGYKGSYMDFVRDRSTRTSETTLTREEAKKAVNTIDRYRQSAEASRGALSEVAQMRALRDGVGYEGGWFSSARTSLGKNLGSALGWMPGIPTAEEAANAEAISSKATEMQLNFTNDTKGAISDAEMRLFGTATPGLDMTDAAADKILAGMEAGHLRTIERAKFYDAYLRQNKTLSGADEAWDTYINANPVLVIDPKTKEMSINKNNIGNWKAYIGSEYAPGDVVDGWRFKGGDAGDRANWEKVQ